MLAHLSIKNYILIENLELDLTPGFTAITGETGAGKSILIGALSMILGNRADTDVMLNKESKCVIEGSFHMDKQLFQDFFKRNELDLDDHIILRREISKNGKSRAFINDTPVKLPIMKELGEKLVDIHSQHQTLLLGESDFQLAILDDYAANRETLHEYQSIYAEYLKKRSELKELKDRKSSLQAEQDFIRFQYDELDSAELKDDELTSLEKEVEILANAEEIKSKLYQSAQIMQLSDENMMNQLNTVLSLTAKVSDYHNEIKELHERLQSSEIELKDIANSLSQLEEGITYDPASLEVVQERLNLIYSMLHKHKVKSVNELISIREELNSKLTSIDHIDDDIESLETYVASQLERLENKAGILHDRRQKVLTKLGRELVDILVQLGMEKAVVKIRLVELDDYTEWGKETVDVMFSANPGSAAAPISRIASGGEMSRIMLAMKSLLSKKNLFPTLILDEIDMGVSGEVAARVGNLLNDMSETMQLIAITHLPQIAGKASAHYKVYKKFDDDRTVSGVNRLSNEERIDEIAAMMSNENVSMAARETAKELLQKN